MIYSILTLSVYSNSKSKDLTSVNPYKICPEVRTLNISLRLAKLHMQSMCDFSSFHDTRVYFKIFVENTFPLCPPFVVNIF